MKSGGDLGLSAFIHESWLLCGNDSWSELFLNLVLLVELFVMLPVDCNVERSTNRIFPCGVRCRVGALKRTIFSLASVWKLCPCAPAPEKLLSGNGQCIL